MKSFAIVGICLLFVAASARLRGELKEYPSQSFLQGVHSGMNLVVNSSTISLVDDTVLPPKKLVYGLSYISSPSPTNRYQGMQTIYDLFYGVSYRLSVPLRDDKNFTIVMNDTLSNLDDPVQFQYSADIYKRNTGVDVFTMLVESAHFAFAGDFHNAGLRFGNVIYLINRCLIPNGGQPIIVSSEDAFENVNQNTHITPKF